MSVTWGKAPQSILTIAQQVIDSYHQELESVNIAFLLRSEASIRNGKKVLGQASKFPEKLKPLVGEEYHFLIWISAEDWMRMTDIQREALIDHKLSHCGWDEDDEKAFIKGHDIEEFHSTLYRYGLWAPGEEALKPALEAALQLELVKSEKAKGKIGTFDITFENKDGEMIMICPKS